MSEVQVLESIKCTAIKHCNGITYKGTSFQSHASIMDDMRRDKVSYDENMEKGFVTSSERFIGRREAAVIAFEAGQTTSDMGQLQSFHIKHPTPFSW